MLRVLIVVGLLLSGCATMRGVEARGRSACEAARGVWKSLWTHPYGECQPVCEPPGPAGWRLWPVVGALVVSVLAEDDRAIPLVVIRHRLGDRAVHAGWAMGRLVWFDADPIGSSPAMFDRSLSDASSGRLRRTPSGPCYWMRPSI